MGDKGIKFHIVVVTDEGTTKKTIEARKVSIGRNPDADLVVSHKDVSRLHLIVTHKDGQVFIEDNNSSNGTFKNQKKIDPKIAIPIGPNDQLRLGGRGPLLQIEIDNPADIAAPKVQLTPTAAALVPLTPNLEGERIITEAKRQAGVILREAEVQADAKAKIIYQRAQDTEKRAEKMYQERLQVAHREAEVFYEKSRVESLSYLTEARAQADKMRDEAEDSSTKLKQETQNNCEEILATAEKQAQELKRNRLGEADAIIKHKEDDLLKTTRDNLAREANEQRRQLQNEKDKHNEEIARQLTVHAKEIEKQLSEHADKMKELEKRFIDETEKFDGFQKVETLKISDLHEAVIKLEDQKKKLEDEFKQTELHLKSEFEKQDKQIREDISSKEETLRVLSIKEKDESAKAAEREKQLIPLKEEFAKIKIDIENNSVILANVKAEKEQAQKDRDAQIQTYKAQLEKEKDRLVKEEEAQAQALKIETMKSVQKYEKELMDNIHSRRKQIAREIILTVETVSKPYLESSSWKKVASELDSQVADIIGSKTVSVGQGKQGPVNGKGMTDSQKSQIFASVFGLILGIFGMWGFLRMQGQLDGSPMDRKVAGVVMAQKEDLERRKFNPPQTAEVRHTYVESVIYTRNFANVYVDPNFQDAWSKAATLYLLKTLRVDEDRSMKAVAITAALVKELIDRKEKIHPDYVDKGLAQMNALEKATLQRLKAELGNDVRVESFKKYEKRFFNQYLEAPVK